MIQLTLSKSFKRRQMSSRSASIGAKRTTQNSMPRLQEPLRCYSTHWYLEHLASPFRAMLTMTGLNFGLSMRDCPFSWAGSHRRQRSITPTTRPSRQASRPCGTNWNSLRNDESWAILTKHWLSWVILLEPLPMSSTIGYKHIFVDKWVDMVRFYIVIH